MMLYARFALLTCATLAAEAQLRCGEAGPEPEDQTTSGGGRPVAPGRYPWMALIGHHQQGGQVTWVCGGALITRRHVLTAAHCLQGKHLWQLRVRLGESDIKATSDGQHQELRPARFVIHPQRQVKHHDIGLITLEEEPAQGPLVRPICLPESGQEDGMVSLEGHGATVAGWQNQQEAAGASPSLHEAQVQILNTATCEKSYDTFPNMTVWYPNGFQSTVVCATDPSASAQDEAADSAGFCGGDSGDPLMVSAADGRFFVAAVAAGGPGCRSRHLPTLYTKVASHMSWIREEVQRDEKGGSTALTDEMFLRPRPGRGELDIVIPP